MRDELLRKVEAELRQEIETERQVVYILVEIRKLLDRDRVPKARSRHLRMLCDWAVHAELERHIVEQHLLLLNNMADQLRTGRMTPGDFERSSKVFDLITARDEFLDFLRAVKLNR
jgi:hypothetical protein